MLGGDVTADEVKTRFGLVPHPREGGWYVRTYEANEAVPASGFADGRYDGARLTGTAIYYLLEPGAFSEMHRLRSDEIFHFYAGDMVEMLQLTPGEAGRRVLLGNELGADSDPQVAVRRGVWQGARLVPGGRWALLGCTVSPGFEFADYESGGREELSGIWPEWAEMIAALTNR